MTRDELVWACFRKDDLAVGDSVYQVVRNEAVLTNIDVYLRRITVGGRPYDIAAVAQVCTDQRFRRKGLATKLLDIVHHDLGDVCDFAALFGVQPLYEAMGYQRTNVPQLLVFPLRCRAWPPGKIEYGAKW